MIIDYFFEILSWISIILGSFLILLGALGFFRFPEFWSRLHAASVIDSGGMILIIVGMSIQAGLTLVTIKLIFIAIFLVITGPTATHAIANAAMISGLGFDLNRKSRIGLTDKIEERNNQKTSGEGKVGT